MTLAWPSGLPGTIGGIVIILLATLFVIGFATSGGKKKK